VKTPSLRAAGCIVPFAQLGDPARRDVGGYVAKRPGAQVLGRPIGLIDPVRLALF
jgi:hypothetical protein